MKSLNGLLPVYKPPGMTSHDVVAIARKKLKIKKIGHCGTLDPFAEGLLIILIGKAVKFQNFFLTMKKKYKAEMMFGEERDSFDRTGTLISTFNKKEINLKNFDFEKIFRDNFNGDINQIPPNISALKINGERAYKKVQKGDEFSLPARQITIYSFKINEVKKNCLNFDIECSSGTYIRSIARDLGVICQIPGYLNKLIRSDIHNFNLKDCIQVDAIRSESILPIQNFLDINKNIELNSDELKKIENGSPDVLNLKDAGYYACYSNNKLFFIIEKLPIDIGYSKKWRIINMAE